MKQSNNNAVDLLLRSLARRERGVSVPGEAGISTDRTTGKSVTTEHLDADELNLYAEGMLAPPARLRYAEHLADCDRCRGLVVGLARAAGTTLRQETTARPSGSGFWQRLGALFALPVVRYGLPALILTSVLGFALLSLRESGDTGPVAKNEQATTATSVAEPTLGDAPGTAPTPPTPAIGKASPRDGAAANAETEANVKVLERENTPQDAQGLLAKSRDADTGAASTVAPTATKEAPIGGVKVQQPEFAAAPPPAPKNEPVTVSDKKALAKKEMDEDLAARRGQDNMYRVQTKDDSPTHGPARSRSLPAGGRADAAPAENRTEAEKSKRESEEETETRTVSGRRFRRQGNAWVDTAYDSSRAITNVGRGSEQFRALIADEPALRTIAQQLGGEVIVVWKNRAYRIR